MRANFLDPWVSNAAMLMGAGFLVVAAAETFQIGATQDVVYTASSGAALILSGATIKVSSMAENSGSNTFVAKTFRAADKGRDKVAKSLQTIFNKHVVPYGNVAQGMFTTAYIIMGTGFACMSEKTTDLSSLLSSSALLISATVASVLAQTQINRVAKNIFNRVVSGKKQGHSPLISKIMASCMTGGSILSTACIAGGLGALLVEKPEAMVFGVAAGNVGFVGMLLTYEASKDMLMGTDRVRPRAPLPK